MHGQNVGGGEPPHPKGTEHRLHHAMRSGDQMYAGCWASGVAIIDVSDIGQPRTLSHYQYDPPRPEPTHTFLKVPFPINGRTIAVSTEEERPQRGFAPGTSPIRPSRSPSILMMCRTMHRPITGASSVLAPTSCASTWTRMVSFTSPGSGRGCGSSTSTIHPILGRRVTSSP